MGGRGALRPVLNGRLADVPAALTVGPRDRVDVLAFERAAAAAQAGDVAAAAAAVALYRDEFLTGLVVPTALGFEAWLLRERERLQAALRRALWVRLADAERRGAVPVADAAARRLLALEPWSESAHRARMRLLARAGRPRAALAQYAACRRLLAAELGLAPTAETTALAARLRA